MSHSSPNHLNRIPVLDLDLFSMVTSVYSQNILSPTNHQLRSQLPPPLSIITTPAIEKGIQELFSSYNNDSILPLASPPPLPLPIQYASPDSTNSSSQEHKNVNKLPQMDEEVFDDIESPVSSDGMIYFHPSSPTPSPLPQLISLLPSLPLDSGINILKR